MAQPPVELLFLLAFTGVPLLIVIVLWAVARRSDRVRPTRFVLRLFGILWIPLFLVELFSVGIADPSEGRGPLYVAAVAALFSLGIVCIFLAPVILALIVLSAIRGRSAPAPRR